MIRRTGTVAVLLGALLTVVFGGSVLSVAVPGLSKGDLIWAPLLAVTGVAAVLSGAFCVWLAAPDLVRGALSRRAERWTWIATAAFAALSIASVWLAGLAVLGPIATLVAVRLARGPRLPPGPPSRADPMAGSPRTRRKRRAVLGRIAEGR